MILFLFCSFLSGVHFLTLFRQFRVDGGIDEKFLLENGQ
jgi:hypothetical protein